ncbi:MAG: PAS domain S-box protein [Sulfurimonas sp.]|uniref:PAS domain S-box protein n=1 Tax=Sulfurimonas sp. TaxID=2022749 RepID=UPI002603F806|nr:PAS domain S-box protein [Sulfurimonas sp.]MDD2652169.1 PAS domain S-box protein [Sulfurimonas sp.]MDD3450548.1 PAS domain S-box protein [Sulfurimonas sp.]
MISKLLLLLFLFLESAFGQSFRESLSEKERAWLDAHPIIKHTGNPQYLPYEAFDANAKHRGMVAEYLDEIEKMIGIKIERVPSSSWEDALLKSKEKQVAMLTNYTNDDEFAATHSITKGFIKSPVVVIKKKTQKYQTFISDFEELKGEKIALERKHAFLKPVIKEYPELDYREVDTIEGVLKGVAEEEFDAALISLNVGTYNISEHGLRNLHVVGTHDFELELGFQIAKEDEVLLGILNKVLDAFSHKQHHEITNRWTLIDIKQSFDYGYVPLLLLIIAAITLLYFFRSYELKKKIEKSTSEISKLLKVFDEHVIASETDLQGNITYVSKAFCRISGYSQKELLGKKHSVIKHPDNDPKIYKELWETVSSGKAWHGLVKNRKKDGGYYWVETVVTQDFDAFGKPFGYMAVRQDVTAEMELKEFNENLEEIIKSRTNELLALNKQQKAVFDSASIGILLLQNRVVKEVNDAFCEMTGYAKDDITGLTTRALCESDASYEKIYDYYKIVEAGAIAGWEQKIVKKDGTIFEAKVRIKAKDEHDTLAGVVATIDDITLEKRALEEIKKAKEMAEDTVKVKGQFLANVSHEIRTPMSAIIGMSHLALESGLSEKQRGYVQKIEGAAKNLLDIINDILDFSKIEAKKMTLEHRAFYLEDVFENLINLFVFKIKEKNLQLLFSIEHNVPSALIGDALKLSQILTNLVSNAIKFTSNGEIIIGVKTKERDAQSARVEFWVQDSGIGLSHEQIERLFSPFEQADGSITRTYGGTGLGLSISKHLVEMMDGTIGVESELGRGSKFYFDIKVDLAEQNRELMQDGVSKKLLTPSNLQDAVLHAFGKKMPKHNGYHEAAQHLRGAEVLLVEDNKENQEIAKELLAKVGVSVTIANNGKEALQKVDEKLFDGVLMDCQMPVMDGYEATSILRQEKQMTSMPVIAMTANAMQEDKERCVKAGMNDFVAKPIDVKLFYTTLAKWIKPKTNHQMTQDSSGKKEGANLYTLDIYGIDIDKALDRVADDEEILFGILKRFAASRKDEMQKIAKMYEEGNFDEFKMAVHTLKGLSGNIEATAVYEALKKLENSIKEEGVNSKTIKSLMQEIDEELKKVVASIETNFSNLKEEKKVSDVPDVEDLQKDIEVLQEHYKNFDSDAIKASQELSLKLYKYLPKQRVEPMLKASLNFDFDVASAALDTISKELGGKICR